MWLESMQVTAIMLMRMIVSDEKEGSAKYKLTRPIRVSLYKFQTR